MKLSEIRANYPEYSDLSDAQLIIGLHRKHYADMPFREFHKNIEYDAPESGFEAWRAKNKADMAKLSEGGWGTGIPKAAYDLGGKVTDLTGSPTAGYVTNVATQAVPALFGYKGAGEAGRIGTQAIAAGEEPSMTTAPAKWLMQSAMKPSSTVSKADREAALLTGLREGFNPTSGGMDKATELATKLNEAVKAPIAASSAEASIPDVIKRLDPLKERAMMQVNPQADIAAVERAISEFKGSPAVSGAESIPVQLAQKLKSGTYTSLGNKAYGELGSASTEAQKQLARGLREEVISKVPEIAEPLKREAAIRNFMEVAASRAAIDANKNPLSLGTSIAAIMHDPLAAAGMWANASTPVKAMLARMLYTGGQPSVALPATMTATEALNQPRP